MSKKTSSIYSPVLNIDDIRAPFPPTITADDLLSRPNGTSKRVPCAFIIYRMSFHRELKSRGFKLSWRQISPMASKAWNNESEEVKQAYTNLCYETKARYNEYSSRDQSETVADVAAEIAVADYNAAGLHMTGENCDVNPYDFNNYITTENGNDLEVGDNLIVSESSLVELKERIRILEERLNLVAGWFGIRFL